MAYRGYTLSQRRATQKYHKEHMEMISIRVPKGKREKYKEVAKKEGTSLTELIVRLLEQEIAHELPTHKKNTEK